jgi:hypothetical protein
LTAEERDDDESSQPQEKAHVHMREEERRA